MNEILFKAYFMLPKHGILKNSKQILSNRSTGKPFIAKSRDAMELEKWMIQKLNIEKLKQRIQTITCDINAKFIFYYPNTVYFTKKNIRSQRLGDISNLVQLPEDCLQKTGIIANDNLIVSLDGCRRKPLDSTSYYLEIELTKAEHDV